MQSIEQAMKLLFGLRLAKCSNILSTRLFHFSEVASRPNDDGCYVLSVECAWRIEGSAEVVVGSDDYGTPAEDNTDPAWDPNSQVGSLQDQRLRELLDGEFSNGEIISRDGNLIVQSIEADIFGGFRLSLSGSYSLSVFPSSSGEMEWMLRRRGGGYLALMHRTLSGVLDP